MTTTRKLGQLSTDELIRTALDELHGLREHLTETGVIDDSLDPTTPALITRSFLASIGARLAVASTRFNKED